MIEITYKDDGKRRELTVEGHGPGPKGKDIFCAAASTLMISLESALKDSDTPYDVDARDGYGQITCEDDRAREWYYLAVRGFLTLASMYGDHYSVKSV